MVVARRSYCRRRFQATCIFTAVTLVAYFTCLGINEAIRRSQDAGIDACADLSEPPLGLIPRVLHHVFLDGEQAYQAEAADEQPAFRIQWRDACRQHYSNWEYRFWTKVRSTGRLRSPLPQDPSACNPSLTASSADLPPFTMCPARYARRMPRSC